MERVVTKLIRNEGGLINEIKIEIYCEDTVRDLQR
jgi:hypothetical protein